MDKYQQLEKTILDLIQNDDLVQEHYEKLTNLGLNIVKNDLHLKIDYKTLNSELLIDMKLDNTAKFMNYYDLEEIDFEIKNFEFTIENIKINNEHSGRNNIIKKLPDTMKENFQDSDHKSRNKVIKTIEEQVNSILKDLENEYKNVGNKINELLENNFSDLKDNSEADIKEKLKNFIKSYKTRRTKKFVKHTIKNSIISKQREYTDKYDKLKYNLVNRFLANGKSVSFAEWRDFFIAKALYKEKDLAVKKLLKDISNYVEGIIDEVFIELATENYELQKEMNKRFNAEIDDIVEVDKRRLLNESWKQCKILFNRAGLSQTEFQKF